MIESVTYESVEAFLSSLPTRCPREQCRSILNRDRAEELALDRRKIVFVCWICSYRVRVPLPPEFLPSERPMAPLGRATTPADQICDACGNPLGDEKKTGNQKRHTACRKIADNKRSKEIAHLNMHRMECLYCHAEVWRKDPIPYCWRTKCERLHKEFKALGGT